MGLYIEMDQWIFNGFNGCCHISSLLSFALHKLAKSAAAQNGGPVSQLWRHPLQFLNKSRHSPATHQSLAAEAVQKHQLVSHQQVSLSRWFIFYLSTFIIFSYSFLFHYSYFFICLCCLICVEIHLKLVISTYLFSNRFRLIWFWFANFITTCSLIFIIWQCNLCILCINFMLVMLSFVDFVLI